MISSQRFLRYSFLASFLLSAPFSNVHAQFDALQKNYRQLTINCAQCHADPSTGAPLIGDRERWKNILQQDTQQLLNTIYQGIKGMPPMGYCSSCSPQDFIAISRIMAGLNPYPSVSSTAGESDDTE